MVQDIIIRSFDCKDRAKVRQIACDTAFMGESCTKFFDGEELFADALTLYYTDHEPESCFVAEKNSKVIGYLIGARDVAVMDQTFKNKIIMPLARKAFASGIFLKKKNIRFFYHIFLSVIRGEFSEPSFAKKYPATLHINIEDGQRCGGVGSKLIAAHLEYLKRFHVKGVHFATFSDAASRFFLKDGFRLLYQTKRSYFRHILNKDVNLYILGKTLY